MCIGKKLLTAGILTVALLGLFSTSTANTKVKKHAGAGLKTRELKEAERLLSEMGYSTGRVDGVIDGTTRMALVTFQKWEGRRLTGRLTRAEFNAIRSASPPLPKDSGYKHVEVDLDRLHDGVSAALAA